MATATTLVILFSSLFVNELKAEIKVDLTKPALGGSLLARSLCCVTAYMACKDACVGQSCQTKCNGRCAFGTCPAMSCEAVAPTKCIKNPDATNPSGTVNPLSSSSTPVPTTSTTCAPNVTCPTCPTCPTLPSTTPSATPSTTPSTTPLPTTSTTTTSPTTSTTLTTTTRITTTTAKSTTTTNTAKPTVPTTTNTTTTPTTTVATA